MTLGYIDMHDRLVANSYKAWSNYKLWAVYAVLWLLGAYLEYVKLTVTRLTAVDRADYLARLANNRLAGGGFEPFFALQEHIDTLIEQVDPDNEADVDSTVAQIKLLFASFPWLSSAFRDLLAGKNHLPNNKLPRQSAQPDRRLPGRRHLPRALLWRPHAGRPGRQGGGRAGALLGAGAQLAAALARAPGHADDRNKRYLTVGVG